MSSKHIQTAHGMITYEVLTLTGASIIDTQVRNAEPDAHLAEIRIITSGTCSEVPADIWLQLNGTRAEHVNVSASTIRSAYLPRR